MGSQASIFIYIYMNQPTNRHGKYFIVIYINKLFFLKLLIFNQEIKPMVQRIDAVSTFNIFVSEMLLPSIFLPENLKSILSLKNFIFNLWFILEFIFTFYC